MYHYDMLDASKIIRKRCSWSSQREESLILRAASVKEWFALSREWIVRGFSDLTNSDVQSKVWIRKA